jgi:hypothetical protein
MITRAGVRRELREFAILTAYLYVCLAAVIFLKAGVLHTYGIASVFWGVAIVKALVLAKFLMIGDMVNLADTDHAEVLIWPTIRKAAAFTALLVVLTVLEEVIVGLFHHHTVDQTLEDLFGRRLEETLAGILILVLCLVPFFAFRSLDEYLGKGQLSRMFFGERRLDV